MPVQPIEYKGISERSANNTKGVRSYTHVHKLHVNDVDYAKEYLVGSDVNLPLIGSQHPEDPRAFCQSLDVAMVTAFGEWSVTANYSTDVEMELNPWYDPAIIEWDGENFEEVAIYDNTGSAILNSAGDPFENVMRERTRRVVTVTKNITSIPPWIISAEDAVNSEPFVLQGITINPGIAKLSAPKIGRKQRRDIFEFYEMTMIIKLNKDNWTLKPLDAGFRYKIGDYMFRCTSDGDGTDPSQPVPLNGYGEILTDPTPSRAVFGSFSLYPEFDFNVLPLT